MNASRPPSAEKRLASRAAEGAEAAPPSVEEAAVSTLASPESAPSKSVRVFLAFLTARAAFGLVFLLSTLRPTPIPWYDPLARLWTFEVRPTEFAMDWFGRTAIAFAFGAVLGAATWLVSARVAWLGRRSVVLAIARAGGLVLLVDFVYFGWVLSHVPASPLPLPSWYCPR
jgi:hypothetical protein